MATKITAAIGPNDRTIAVDSSTTTLAPFHIQIDTEVLRVVNGAGTLYWDVERHLNGTLAVAHAINAGLTEVASDVMPAVTLPAALSGGVFVVEKAIAENGAGTYTATVAIPAGATVLDVIFRNTVVWAAATSAAMTCGDTANATGYYSSTNVKTTPAADTNGAGAGLSTRLSLGASAGTYKGGGGKFYATADTITCTVTSVGAGTAGRSRLLVEYAIPATSIVTQ